MKSRFLLMLVCSLYGVTCSAFIYDIVVLKRWDPSYQRYHYVIGCSDFHDKSHPCTGEQRSFIESLLRLSDPQSVKVIVEDLSAGNELCNGMCGMFKVDSRGGLLGGLMEKCRAFGLSVDNVEYRYCRVSALGPTLNNLTQSPHSFLATAQLKVQTVVDELERVTREIRSYKDGGLLNTYYQKAIRSVTQGINVLKKEHYYQQSVADFLENKEDKKRLEVIKDLLTFDINVFDARLVHAIAKSVPYEKVLIFAGGAHVSRATSVLKTIGYQVEYEAPVAYRKEYDLHRCVGSEIVDGAFCLCPQPVDISIIKHMIGQ